MRSFCACLGILMPEFRLANIVKRAPADTERFYVPSGCLVFSGDPKFAGGSRVSRMGRMLSATYRGVNGVHMDRAGNLRLYERGRFGWRRQRAFHPASEWEAVSLTEVDALVTLLRPNGGTL